MTILKKMTLVLATSGCFYSVQTTAADFEFDRPGNGFSTTVVPVGRVAWEQSLPNVTYREFKDASGLKGNELGLQADVLLRTGVTQDLELQLGWAGPSWKKTRLQGQHHEEDGLGDVSIGVKKLIDLNDEKMSLAMLAQAQIATGNDGFTDQDDIYTFATAVNYLFNDQITTNLTMKYEVQNSDWAVTAIPTLGYTITGNWSGYSQLIYRKAEGQDNEYSLASGVIYALNERFQLDVDIGFDLNGSDKSYKSGLGFSYLF